MLRFGAQARRAARLTLAIAVFVSLAGAPARAEEPLPQTALHLEVEAERAPHAIGVLGPVGAPGDRVIPVGAFCPARPADPLREASTFGLTALVMWALVRRRERGDESLGDDRAGA